jgi:hypothetical protein
MRKFKAAATLSCALLANVSDARPTDYSSFDSWLGATGNSATLDFIGVEPGASLANVFASAGVTFDGSDRATSGDVFADSAGARGGNNYLTVTFDPPTRGVGIDFVGQLYMAAYTSDGFARAIYLGNTNRSRGFGGVVLSQDISRVVITSRYGADVAIDNLHWMLVPEPASSIVLMGAFGLAFPRRR